MCDYSLHHVKSRPAKVGDKLVTREFIGTLTRGFASPEDLDVAVCVLSGTELSFSDNVRRIRLWAWSTNVIKHKTAIFRQVNLKQFPAYLNRWDSQQARNEGVFAH